jgi:hypothetical protein
VNIKEEIMKDLFEMNKLTTVHGDIEGDLYFVSTYTTLHYTSNRVFYSFSREGATRRVYPW